MTAAVPRRERVRLATIDEIKQIAREHLATRGAAALSLRAVARDMGMMPSALYRYFASRDDLLTALVTDGFASLADALEVAYAAAPPGDHGERWLTVVRAYRRWALDHPEMYALLYGRPVPGYEAPEGPAKAELWRGVAVLFRVMADALAADAFDLAAAQAWLSAPLRAGLTEWARADALPLPPAALSLCMLAWTQVHGAISLELFGHLPPPLRESPALFEQLMRDVLRAMGHRGPI